MQTINLLLEKHKVFLIGRSLNSFLNGRPKYNYIKYFVSDFVGDQTFQGFITNKGFFNKIKPFKILENVI